MPTAALVSGSVTDKNFAAILRAEHDVVRQVEDGSGVLDVTTVFWRLKFYVISLPCAYLFFKYLYALTCRLKSAVRRAVTYRGIHFDRPFIEECWLIDPLAYRIQRSLLQQRMSRDRFQFPDCPVLTNDDLEPHHALDACLAGCLWIHGLNVVQHPRCLDISSQSDTSYVAC